MQRNLIIAVFAVAVSAIAIGQTHSKKTDQNSKIEQAVRQVERERVGALLRGDTVVLDHILADDLTYTHSTGRVDTKAQFLAALKSGDLKYRAMDHEDVNVRIYGDTAVVTGRSRVNVRSQGQDSSFPIRFIEVYVKQKQHWQMVAWQSVRTAQQ